MITYLEHYPHYMGTMNTTVKFTDENFALLLALAGDNSEEAVELMDYEFEDLEEFFSRVGKDRRGPYALLAAIQDHDSPQKSASKKRIKQILHDLSTRGYWVDCWEEGSHAFALKGYEEQAINAIARLESRIAQDSFIW